MNKHNAAPIFSRNVSGTTEVLQKATVGIAGCGGLGSNAAVSLVRAGVGRLIIADFDVVEASNLNRQFYFQSDIGEKKIQALARHLRAVNPEVQLDLVDKKLGPADIIGVFKDADLLIEAFDRAESKVWLIETWVSAFPGRPVVCASGVSGVGKTDSLSVRRSGNIYIAGDGETDMSAGLCAARVGIAANMEANIALELLLKAKE
jgi:sulfur carrier protein ThiS adenylyltransferase